MNNNYLIYPCTTMRITQSYNGKTSHLPHTKGNHTDFPIDEGCDDSGKSDLYCPCNEMQVKRIYGVGTGGTNTLWLERTGKVLLKISASDITDFRFDLCLRTSESEFKEYNSKVTDKLKSIL